MSPCRLVAGPDPFKVQSADRNRAGVQAALPAQECAAGRGNPGRNLACRCSSKWQSGRSVIDWVQVRIHAIGSSSSSSAVERSPEEGGVRGSTPRESTGRNRPQRSQSALSTVVLPCYPNGRGSGFKTRTV